MTVEAIYHWILTATPMINRVPDYMGYLLIFWRPGWEYDVFGDDLTRSYEPSFWEGIPSTYQHWVGNTPLFVLNPRNFARLANRGHLTGQVVRDVLQAILSCVQLRRTKATEIVVDGVPSRIGETIPHYEIVTVELKLTMAQQRIYDQMYSFYADQLARQKGVGEEDGADMDTPTAGAEGSGGAPVITELGIRNNGMHRRLCLMSHDSHLETFCSRARGRSMAKDIEGYFHTCADDGMSAFYALACPEVGMLPPIDRFSFGDWMALQSPKLQYICVILHDAIFARPYVTADGEFLATLPPEEEASTDLTKSPPPPTAASKQPRPIRRRILFFGNWPGVVWHTYGFIGNLGLRVLALRTGMEASELRDAITEWNDPDSNVDCMVAGIQFATGLNLHKACCEIVIIEVSLSTTVA